MTAARKTIVDFEIIIDDHFVNYNGDKTLQPDKNKRLLSIINGFEDGKWRYKIFQDFVWNNISETALSYQERMALVDKTHSSLTESAKKLRLTDLEGDQGSQGSELAEIVLYGIMKNHYGAIPVVPKIFYKQNPQDNAKGADSVHIVLGAGEDFTLWLGEAKFYSSIANARLGEIITSVENGLQTEKLKKENSIITNVQDLDKFLHSKPEQCAKIKALLSTQASIDMLKPVLNIPILLLHECPITAKHVELTDEYRAEIEAFHIDRANAYFRKQVDSLRDNIFKYEAINFHIILFPVPEKAPIINKFVENVVHYKNQ